MTAYVNDEQKKEGAYGKAVKATLAATLAAGMVPAAAAFAEEPAEATAENNDVEVLAVSPETSFKAGKVTAAKDNEGKVVADLAKVSFVADGKEHYIVPTEFIPDQGKAIDVTDSSKYEFKYYEINEKGEKGNLVNNVNTLVKPGSYGVTVTDKASNWESDIAATFTIGSASLKDATLFEGTDVEDAEFVYTGSAIDLKLALNGEEVESSKYEMKFYPKGSGVEVVNWNAGEYVAVVKGAKNTMYEGQEVKIPFTIDKLDVSKAVVDLGSFKGNALNSEVENVKVDGVVNVVEAKVTSVPADIYNNPKGVYKVTVTAKGDNATGTQVVEYVKTTEKTAVIKYDGQNLKSDYTTDYSAEKPEVFDVKKLAAYKDANAIEGAKVNIVVRENDKDGDIVKNADLTKPGTWYVTVSLDPASVDYANASAAEQTFKVKVVDGSVDEAADVFVKYNGAVVDGMTGKKALTYTGEDLFKNVSVVVNSGDKTLVAGKDYEIALTKKVDGDDVAVNTMVDAGSYKLTISSVNYDFADTIEFEVKAINADNLRLDPSTTLHGEGWGYAYTGEAIVPVIQYHVENSEFATLPADAYKLEVTDMDGKKVSEIKAVGAYKLIISDIEGDNYDVYDEEITVIVSDDKLFVDVAPSDWFYEHVYDAKEAGYMIGIGNSDIFAPNQTTSRAMAAQVLARMAGAKDGVEAGMSFSDVAADAWYANAVAWAASTGIVIGYPGTTEFRPESNVTRVEFCAMMQRYAKATGQGVDLAEGEADEILAKYEDGASVPAWAKDAVAWAVKNEIFGGYKVLDPMGDITRAQMAKMTTVFQPEAL